MLNRHSHQIVRLAVFALIGWGMTTPAVATNLTFMGLGDLSGGDFISQAYGVSGDGSTVVGWSSSGQNQAFRWTQSTGMVGLGDLPGGAFYSEAYGVSGNGSIVVGWSETGASTVNEAFIWDSSHGMRNLRSVLTNDYGLDLSGWTLTKATAVSQDGTAIVGYGQNPSGQAEAWIVVVPEPSTLVLAGLGVAGSMLVLRRRKSRPAST